MVLHQHNFKSTIAILFCFVSFVNLIAQTPPSNDLCSNAILIECGQEIEGTTVNATSRDIFNGCSFEGRGDLWYQFEGTGQFLVFDIDPNPFNNILQIDIFEEGCDENASCITSFRAFRGAPVGSRSFLTKIGVIYNIRVEDIFSLPFFNLSIKCFNQALNNECSGASDLMCNDLIQPDFNLTTPSQVSDDCVTGNDLWYTVRGTNEFITLSLEPSSRDALDVELYNSDCINDDMPCLQHLRLSALNSTSFFLEDNTEFLLRIIGSFNDDSVIMTSCNPIEKNDECPNRSMINCGDRITGSTRFSFNDNTFMNCVRDRNSSDVWFEIIGDDQRYEFISINSPVQAQIYIGSDCESLDIQCPVELDITSGSRTSNNSFSARAGLTYLIRIVSDNSNEQGRMFEFDVFCTDDVFNDNCIEAQIVECNDQVNGSFEFATASNVSCDFESGRFGVAGLWYGFNSTKDAIYDIQYISRATEKTIFVYQDFCPSSNCFGTFEDLGSDTLLESISLPVGNYFFYISSENRSNNDQDFTFEVSCAQEEIPPIPTLTEWGLFMLFLMFNILVLVRLQGDTELRIN